MNNFEEEYFEENKKRKIIHQMTINAKGLSFDGFDHDFHVEEQDSQEEVINKDSLKSKPISIVKGDFNKNKKSLL